MEKNVSGPVEVAPVIPLVSVISSDLELIRDAAKLLEACFG